MSQIATATALKARELSRNNFRALRLSHTIFGRKVHHFVFSGFAWLHLRVYLDKFYSPGYFYQRKLAMEIMCLITKTGENLNFKKNDKKENEMGNHIVMQV